MTEHGESVLERWTAQRFDQHEESLRQVSERVAVIEHWQGQMNITCERFEALAGRFESLANALANVELVAKKGRRFWVRGSLGIAGIVAIADAWMRVRHAIRWPW